MTARDTYNSSVKTAASTAFTSLTSNQTTKQETINASGVNVGYNLQTGNYTNFATAVKNANNAKFVADILAEHNKQVAITNARDLLRDSGDKAPS